jgi:hypothetical protein
MLELGGGSQSLANLKIPPEIMSGVSILDDMTNESYEKILNALKTAPTSFVYKRELTAWVSSEVPEVSTASVEKLIETLTSFSRVPDRARVSLSQMVGDITSHLKSSSHEKDTLPLQERLSSLIPLESLKVIEVKAKELQMQGERLLMTAKVITDARPVFADKVGETPAAMVIIQALQIRFYDSGSGDSKEMYISLDSKDIGELKKMLQRAEEKSECLKNTFKSAGIKIVDLD